MIEIFQKKSYIISEIAKYLLEKKVGDRIDSIREFEKRLETSRGTVQNSFQYLKDISALSLVSSGRNGTFIESLDYEKLIGCTGITQLIGAMPLPYSKTYEGLATGLFATGKKHEIGIRLAYMRGSIARIELLLDGGCNFVVLSEIAAEAAISKGYPLKIVHRFPNKSYIKRPHVLILGDKDKTQIENGMKVGYDMDSLDLEILTTEISDGIKVELIDMMYHQLVKSIEDQTIDAAIWNADEIDEKKLDIHFVELPKTLEEKASRAVIAVQEGKGLASIISRYDMDLVVRRQGDVVSGKCFPVY